VLQFPNFRYQGNNGQCDVYFNDTDKLLDLENPRLVNMTQISTTPLDCPTPKTPTLVQTSCFYLWKWPSYCRSKLP